MREFHITYNQDIRRTSKDKDIELLSKSANRYNVLTKCINSSELWKENKCPSYIMNISFLNETHLRYHRWCEINGSRYLNPAFSTMIADDKGLSHLEMKNLGLIVPKTLDLNLAWRDVRMLDKISDELKFPMVIKPPKCGLGIGVHLIQNRNELESLFNLLWTTNILYNDNFSINNFIIQEYIPNSNIGLRVIAINKRVVAAAKRTISNSWNLKGTFLLDSSIINKTEYKHNEIIYEKYPLDLELTNGVEKIVNHFNLRFAGIDVMFHKNGYCYNEINTIAGLWKMNALFDNLNIIDSIFDTIYHQ